jgi:putative sterol carrier protein
MKSKMAPHRFTSLGAALCVLLCFAGAGPAALADDSKNKTPADVFDGMRKSFDSEKAKGVHASYQWNISGPDGGDWYIVVNDGKCDMGKGTTPNPDVTFTVSDKDWVAISNDELSGSWAFITGRLKIKGPQSIAKKLDGMFP